MSTEVWIAIISGVVTTMGGAYGIIRLLIKQQREKRSEHPPPAGTVMPGRSASSISGQLSAVFDSAWEKREALKREAELRNSEHEAILQMRDAALTQVEQGYRQLELLEALLHKQAGAAAAAATPQPLATAVEPPRGRPKTTTSRALHPTTYRGKIPSSGGGRDE